MAEDKYELILKTNGRVADEYFEDSDLTKGLTIEDFKFGQLTMKDSSYFSPGPGKITFTIEDK